MKVLTLDYSIWRCGGQGAWKLGYGETKMCNTQGWMCCLGQLAKQLDPTIKESELIDRGYPRNVSSNTLRVIPALTIEIEDPNYPIHFDDTDFASIAARINDNEVTTPAQKIQLLTVLCQDHGYILQVINNPYDKPKTATPFNSTTGL